MTDTPTPPTLYAHADVARCLATASAAVVLVGSYDGSTNFGDIAQHAEAVRLVRSSGTNAPIVSVVERQYREELEALARRRPDLVDVDIVYFDDADGPPTRLPDDVVPLEELPSRVLFYLYGGGYVNARWGGRKAAMLLAARRLVGGRWFGHEPYVRVVATGLQITNGAGALAADLHGATYVGVRDSGSMSVDDESLRSRVRFTGDDAVAFLVSSTAATDDGADTLNVHVSVEEYVTEASAARLATVRTAVVELVRRAGLRAVNVLVAFPDARIAEGEIAARLRDDLTTADDLVGTDVCVVDVIERLVARQPALPSAAACITSSYHVGLTSLAAGVPTVMVHRGDYYGQKMSGLAQLFGVSEEFLLADDADPESAVARCHATMADPRSSATFRSSTRDGVITSLLARSEAERAVLREIMSLDGGAGWEQARRLGERVRSCVDEVTDLRERVENLLLVGRASAKISDGRTGGKA